jgi:uncharacterized cupin superfamily protein
MIKVVRPDTQQLEEVTQWPIWEKEPSSFDWDYTEKEVFYILEGTANLSSSCGLQQPLKAGDLVTVKQGILVHWEITAPIRKHYKFY